MNERTKSISIVVLCFSMICLLVVNLTLSLDSSRASSLRAFLGIDQGVVESTGTTYYSGASIMPVRLGVVGENGLYVAAGEQVTPLLSDVTPIISEALGSVSKISAINQEYFLNSLSSEGIYFSFTFPISFSLLQYCWTGEMGYMYDQSASVLMVTSVGQKVMLAFYDGAGDKYYIAETSAGIDRFEAICQNAMPSNAFFAFQADGYQMLAPYESVWAEDVYYPTYTITAPDFTAESDLSNDILSAFNINPFLAKVYKTSNEDTVYIEGYSTLQLSKNGCAIFSTTGDNGIDLDIPPGLSEKETVVYLVRQSADVLNKICQVASCQGQLSVSEISSEDGVYIVAFDRMLGGAQITEEDGYSAVVTIANGRMVSIKLWIKNYTRAQNAMLLPQNLAISLFDGEDNRLFVRYTERDGLLMPGIYRLGKEGEHGVE